MRSLSHFHTFFHVIDLMSVLWHRDNHLPFLDALRNINFSSLLAPTDIPVGMFRNFRLDMAGHYFNNCFKMFFFWPCKGKEKFWRGMPHLNLRLVIMWLRNPSPQNDTNHHKPETTSWKNLLQHTRAGRKQCLAPNLKPMAHWRINRKTLQRHGTILTWQWASIVKFGVTNCASWVLLSTK